MTIQDKINELQKQIDALKAEAAKQDDAWPKNRDSYFALHTGGDINNCRWSNDAADKKIKQRGLIFRTKEEAERYDKRRILIAAIREFAGHYKPVWDIETENYTISYSHFSDSWGATSWSTDDHIPTCGYFKDEATARACIEKFKDELHLLREV